MGAKGEMMARLIPGLLSAILLASGCVGPYPSQQPLPGPVPLAQAGTAPVDGSTAARNFVEVVTRMEPVVEQECRQRSPQLNCDFFIVVDDRPGQPPNAFQTEDRQGRPVIAFTLPLIAEARNQDELAFVMGHEASHHILGHLERTRESALTGALILGTLASLGGGGDGAVSQAQQIGASVGARRYSQDFELEADRLGTEIAFDAGFDPGRGALFFDRLPDPGNTFLGSHPPNAERTAAVQETLARLRGF
jgi:Zn-dependent protease with chaperone function